MANISVISGAMTKSFLPPVQQALFQLDVTHGVTTFFKVCASRRKYASTIMSGLSGVVIPFLSSKMGLHGPAWAGIFDERNGRLVRQRQLATSW